MKKPLLVFFILSIMAASCRKETEAISINDELTDSQIQILESAGIDTISQFTDALFPDGSKIHEWQTLNDLGHNYEFSRIFSTPDKKRLFITRMTEAGYRLVNYNVTTQPNGLAYVWGSKSITIATKSPEAKCQELIFGLDCSGMIYQMAKASGIQLPKGNTKDYADNTTWNSAFNNSPDFQGLIMEVFTNLPLSQIEPGDIIVKSGNHIGMVNNSISKGFLNSIGRPSYSCEKNSDANHGPVITKSLGDAIAALGSDYKVLRVTSECGTVTDIDGNRYNTIRIGSQCWMVENLRTSKYRNGDPIPRITNTNQWANLTVNAWCHYNNDSTYEATYGKLYNWFCVSDSRNLAPAGWHIPTESEWDILINFLGGQSAAGGKMKGLSLWNSPNTGATNNSGFTGLPGGSRTYMGNFNRIGTNGYWWTTTQHNTNANLAWGPDLSHSFNGVNKGAYIKTEGFAIRCIKD